MSKHLFIVCHPDDEAVGPAPLIHHLAKQGADIHVGVMCVTNFVSLRTGKATDSGVMIGNLERSLRNLGLKEKNSYSIFKKLLSLSLVDEYEITGFIDRLTMDYQPDFVYFPWQSHHHDHRRIHNCCLASTRLSRHNPLVKSYFFYEYPFSQFNHNNDGGYYIELDKDDVDAAVNSCKIYSGLLDNNSLFSPDGIRALFAMRGYEIAKDYAIKLTMFKTIQKL